MMIYLDHVSNDTKIGDLLSRPTLLPAGAGMRRPQVTSSSPALANTPSATACAATVSWQLRFRMQRLYEFWYLACKKVNPYGFPIIINNENV